MKKKTLVLGASTNPTRYSNIAANRLQQNGHEIVLIGNKKGQIATEEILIGQPVLHDIDTITIYLNPIHQAQYYDYILSLQPKRIIFNPGSENAELMHLAKENGIEVEAACTLVLLSTQSY